MTDNAKIGADDYAYDFFFSRRGAVGAVAAEVAAALEGAGYQVKVQDHDFGRSGDFVGDIHDALIKARHLVVMHTADYDRNVWTRKEFTSFLAAAAGCPQRTRRSGDRGTTP